MTLISKRAVKRRAYWVKEIAKLSGRFGDDVTRVDSELKKEIAKEGSSALLDHLRLCGAIPEKYDPSSSEEKLYSKYTDALLAAVYREIGLTAMVLAERADAADVEAVAKKYSLVGDAKAFRLSRTAKNQKDFKIEATDGWKRGKPHAMVVCPIYQLPARKSQIYHQAINRTVCIFSYSHMAVLTVFAGVAGKEAAEKLLLSILQCAEAMNPDKDAVGYWLNLNRAMLNFDKRIRALWDAEKLATEEAIKLSKEESLTFLASERESIMKMSRDDAISALIEDRNIDGRERMVRAVTDSRILAIE